MEMLPAVLVILSTFMHATWNILVKREECEQACIWRMQLFIVAVGLVPAVLAIVLLRCVTSTAALCLLGSGVSCGLYFVCLGKGYQKGDFTMVYPAARAIPVVLVGLGDALRGRPPSPMGWLGIALVASGCLIVPLTSFRDIRLRHYVRPSSIWIVLAAAGTVGYSLLDKIGSESVSRGAVPALVYCYLFFFSSTVFYVPLRGVLRGRSPRRMDVGWKTPALAGVFCFLAYWLVVCAYQMTTRASYVVAFRQFSIVIGVLIAIVVLKEPGKRVRLVGALVITGGLILLKVFGN